MRISDWSSNVCSSDLLNPPSPESPSIWLRGSVPLKPGSEPGEDDTALSIGDRIMQIRNNYELGLMNGDIGFVRDVTVIDAADYHTELKREIGRASCRERVCQYV